MSSNTENSKFLTEEQKARIAEQCKSYLKNNNMVMVSFFTYPDYGNVFEPDGRAVYLVPAHMRDCLPSEADKYGVLLHSS